jgi:hypothetical protein
MTHIRNTTTDMMWCKEPLTNDFYFKDVEQALVNGLFGNKPICLDCSLNILKCLETHNKTEIST